MDEKLNCLVNKLVQADVDKETIINTMKAASEEETLKNEETFDVKN